MSPIKGLSDRRRMPRLGTIRLGIKVKSEKGMEYPKETDYFVVPKKVAEIYGDEPKELKIMFPVENENVFFQQYYKSYGYNLLKCKGDGETAWTWDEEGGGLKEIPCPCGKLESGDCKQIGILQFLLPEVPGAGVWQVTTSSKNSIVDVNSGVEYIRAICGRIRMIPLVLKRELLETQRIENGKPKKGKHYTLKLDLDNISLRQLQQAAQVDPEKTFLPSEPVALPPPDESQEAVDDLFPKDGFEPKTLKEAKEYLDKNEKKSEEPEKETVEEKEPQEENESESDDFSDATYAEDAKESENATFRNIPLVLSNGKKRIVTKFEAYRKFSNLKKILGNMLYYKKLGLFGYEHANEIPDKLLPDVYGVLVEAWKESQKKQVV